MYTQDKIQVIPLSRSRRSEKLSYCTDDEIHLLRGLLGSLSWLAKESRPDLSGRVALLQQSMPRPYVQDLLEANALAREALEDTEVGVVLRPVPLEYLRVGTITDASWGNSRSEDLEESWRRRHVLPRRLMFHPGAVSDGPDLLSIADRRRTIFQDGTFMDDAWNGDLSTRDGPPWTGVTEFQKVSEPRKSKTSERFLQRGRTSSQAGSYGGFRE